MRLNTLLVPLTVGLLILTVGIVVNHIANDPHASASSDSTTSNVEGESSSSVGRSLLSGSKSLFVTGVSSKIPEAADYRLLNTVPWEAGEIGRLFRDAGVEMSCQLLEPASAVVQPMIEPSPNVAGPLGRQSAFSIRLQIGKELGEGLPSISRGIIEDYLKAHQLTIQPTFYYDEAGQLILSPNLRAAFVRLDTPEKSTVPESMIETSIKELRTLGAYWDESKPFTAASCRTLILGFRYTLAGDTFAARGNPKREYELLFLHLLPESTVKKPKLAVFATSEGRTEFHLLEENDPDSVEQMAAITADVRFADARLLGVYPEAPVVTRVRHRALLSIPVEVVKSQAAGLSGTAPVGGFSAVLDDLYRKVTGTEAQPVESAEPLIPRSKNSANDEKSETLSTEKSGEQNSKPPEKTIKPGFDA